MIDHWAHAAQRAVASPVAILACVAAATFPLRRALATMRISLSTHVAVARVGYAVTKAPSAVPRFQNGSGKNALTEPAAAAATHAELRQLYFGES